MALLAGGAPLRATAWIQAENRSDRVQDRLILFLHSELGVQSIQGSAGEACRWKHAVMDAAYSYSGDIQRMDIDLPTPVQSGEFTHLSITYAGSFSPSSVRSPSDYMRVDKEGAYLRGLAYSYWFPTTSCGPEGLKDTSGFEIRLDIPERWRPLVFGNPISEAILNGRNLSEWQSNGPWPLHACHLAATAWSVSESSGVKVYHRADPDSRLAAAEYGRALRQLVRVFGSWFEQDLSPLPVLLGQMCRYGGIACGNVMGIPEDRFHDVLDVSGRRNALALLAHELAHRYVVPAINPSARGAALLLEAFPCYFDSVGLETILGAGYRRDVLLRAWASYDAGRQSNSALPDVPLLDLGLEEVPRYKDHFLLPDKATILLDRMRSLLGDETFFRGAGRFLEAHRTRPASFHDFTAYLRKEGKTDLGSFAAEWFETTEPLPTNWRPRP